MLQNGHNALFGLLETNDVTLMFLRQTVFQIFSNRCLDKLHDVHYNFL